MKSLAPALSDDCLTVGALDMEFQEAVKLHDVATIEHILHEDMILVLGRRRGTSIWR